jgi:hypothetical protein
VIAEGTQLSGPHRFVQHVEPALARFHEPLRRRVSCDEHPGYRLTESGTQGCDRLCARFSASQTIIGDDQLRDPTVLMQKREGLGGVTGNVPNARYEAASWIDASGSLWLQGGNGRDSVSTTGDLNDLWKYTPSTGLWTWVSGSATANALGVYGTLGTPAAGNVAGARYLASSWIDGSGQLWMFGGHSGSNDLNDLWKFTP